MQNETFLSVDVHFNLLVEALNARDLKTFNQCKHLRTETGYRDRNFIVYRMANDEPVMLDRLIVNDFSADEEKGASTVIVSSETKRTITVSYTPTRIFDYPVFMWIPLHAKIRWGATAQSLHKGTLGFPLVVKTRSRFHLREEGVTYCETGFSYGKEFNTPSAE